MADPQEINPQNQTQFSSRAGRSSAAEADIARILRQAAHLGQTGALAAATAQCQQILQQYPDTAEAWHLLGLVALQQKQTEIALAHLERAIALNPSVADYHSHAGVAHCNLGNFEAGVACYQRALSLHPQSIDIRYNLGLALQKLGRLDQALQAYLRLIAQQPHHAPAHYQLGNICQQQQKLMAAIAHYQQAIQHHPQYPEAWYNLGVAYQAQAELQPALAAYQQALAIAPQYVEAHNGLGAVFEKRGQATLAIQHYQQALALQPAYVPALTNLGNVCLQLEQFGDAETAYRRVLQLEPDNTQTLDSLIKVLLKTCNWSALPEATTALKQHASDRIRQNIAPQISPLNTLYLPFSAQAQQVLAQEYGGAIAQKLADRRRQLNFTFPRLAASSPTASSLIPSSPPKRLRLGYVSGDFRYHPIGQLIFRLFELHDRQQFEVFAYSLGPDDGSKERQKLIQDCDCFREIGSLTPAESAQQIYQDGIDLLIDLAGYTDYASPELFALRPAPLQINYLGYPGTLGVDHIDYIITDAIVTPPEQAACLTEQCIYLPDSYQINNDQQPLPESNAESLKTQNCLPETAFVFCCFNKSQKIEPEIFAVWMRILQQVPDSVLWLLGDRPETAKNLRTAAAAQGIDPTRLIFAARVPKAEHLTRHTCADLFLDTRFYNAHVTASDALWAGVPLITILGETFAARVAASLLTAVGLPQLITHSLESYEHLAVHLATHPTQIQQLKEQLERDRFQSPLFNTALTVRHLEAGYRLIWERYQSHQPPQTVWVSRLKQTQIKTQKNEDAAASKPKTEPIKKPANGANRLTHKALIPSSDLNLLSQAIACTADEGFLNWLSQAAGSLIVTTYQAGKAILIGWNGQQITVLPRQFTKPMGIAVAGDRLALATQHEITLFANAQPLADHYLEDQPGRYDALYLPRATYFTGDLNVHDLAFGEDGLWIVNTRFSCLATLSQDYSFVPRWQPPFISKLAPEDRCHLNGLAMVSGKPKYVTALGQSDQVGGWRANRAQGGVLIDVETDEILLRQLSMPHSPCWQQGKLWLLNSGTGEVWRVDPATQQSEVVCVLPGFGRGLCLVGDYAIVGLSQIRERHIFGELPVQQQFKQLICGVAIINLRSGTQVGLLEFPSGCRELYSVMFLPKILRPTLLNLEKEAVREAFIAPEFAYWLRPSTLIKEPASDV